MSRSSRRVTSTHRVRYLVSDFRYWWRLHGPSVGEHRGAAVVAASALILFALGAGAVIGITSLLPSASAPSAPAISSPIAVPVATEAPATTATSPRVKPPPAPPPATRPPKPTTTTPPASRKDTPNDDHHEQLRPARGR